MKKQDKPAEHVHVLAEESGVRVLATGRGLAVGIDVTSPIMGAMTDAIGPGQIVRIHQTSGSPCATITPVKGGPAKVNSRAYRAGYDAIRWN